MGFNKYSIFFTLKSIYREVFRGHIFRYYYYMKIKKNEYNEECLDNYIKWRLKKIKYALNMIDYPESKDIKDFIAKFSPISKVDVISNYPLYISTKAAKFIYNYARTSGTSGTPLKIKQSLESVQLEEAFSYRQRKWTGYSLFDRIVWIRGDKVVSPSQVTPPYWCRDYFLNRLLMSSYHISSKSSYQYIKQIEKFNPILIEAYPSSIVALARWMKDSNYVYNGSSLKAVMTSSEVFTDEDKCLVMETFGCKVYDWYGQAEHVAAIGTCEFGNQHLLTDYSFVEIDRDGKQEIIGTSYNNVAMPLIRYKTGDFFEMSNNTCECGRIFPIVKKIYGRSEKGFQLSNGRKIVFLDHAFKTIPNLMEAQIVQKNADKFIVNLVLNDSFDDKYLEVIFKDLVDRMGDVDISFNKVDHIQRGKNGKFEFLKVDIDE